MFTDERINTLKNGNARPFSALCEADDEDVQVRIPGNMIGYVYTDTGPGNQVLSLWGNGSMDDHYRRRAQLQESLERQAYTQQTHPLMSCIKNRFLTPAGFSPIGGISATASQRAE